MSGTVFSPPACDDAFRTLLNDCRKLIIPVINEMFGESYTGAGTELHKYRERSRYDHERTDPGL